MDIVVGHTYKRVKKGSLSRYEWRDVEGLVVKVTKVYRNTVYFEPDMFGGGFYSKGYFADVFEKNSQIVIGGET